MSRRIKFYGPSARERVQAEIDEQRKRTARAYLLFDIKVAVCLLIPILVIKSLVGPIINHEEPLPPAAPAVEAPVEPVPAVVQADIAELAEEQEAPTDLPAPNSTWFKANKEYPLSTSYFIECDEGTLYNFNELIAVGRVEGAQMWSDVETEYGFILSVLDNDTVCLQPYDYGTGEVTVTSVSAERRTGDYLYEGEMYEYVIDGYRDCKNGFGIIRATFSNGLVGEAAVYRQNDSLYVANITEYVQRVKTQLDYRNKLQDRFDALNVYWEDTVYTEDICYPIVPANASETTDAAYWLDMSSKLVKSDWTDMHKVIAFYDYCRENMAYDNWVLSQGDKSRWHLYGDYTGNSYISRLHVGICEDFSNVIAIMCRAQDIPALITAGSGHAWVSVYIADYDRWIPVDVTPDLKWNAMTEDVTARTPNNGTPYRSVGYQTRTPEDLYIGNPIDMKRYGITFPWENRQPDD